MTYSEPKFSLPFILSVAVHLAIIIALIVVSPISSTYRLDTTASNPQPVVHASVIDSVQVQAQVQAIQSREAQQQAAQQQQLQQLQAQADAVRQAKVVQEQRLAQIKIDQQKAQQQQQLMAQQVQAEQQHLVQLKAQQKQQQEAQAQALALKKQQEAAQAKAAAEKKQRDLTAAKQKQAELAAQQTALQQQLMQQQIASDQQQLAQAQQTQGLIDQYRARILRAIANQWLVPDGTNPKIFCVFTLDLTPAGVVTHAQLLTSSGNAALDRAAETAIYKASPLPVPQDPTALATFRHFTLKMTPQDIAR